jgi:hypothetical protein
MNIAQATTSGTNIGREPLTPTVVPVDRTPPVPASRCEQSSAGITAAPHRSQPPPDDPQDHALVTRSRIPASGGGRMLRSRRRRTLSYGRHGALYWHGWDRGGDATCPEGLRSPPQDRAPQEHRPFRSQRALRSLRLRLKIFSHHPRQCLTLNCNKMGLNDLYRAGILWPQLAQRISIPGRKAPRSGKGNERREDL